MNFPTLYSRPASREMIQEFRGYNHNLRIGEGEMFDDMNLSSDRYPVLAPRKPRGLYDLLKNEDGTPAINGRINGMIEKDALCYVAGTQFYIGNLPIIGLDLSDTPKQLVSMGAYVIILPDKVYVNTATREYGKIEKTFTASVDTNIRFTMCRQDGSAYPPPIISAAGPDSPENGATWIDTSSEPHALKQWSSSMGVWVSIATTYVKIECSNIGLNFEQFDGVEISGIGQDVFDAEGNFAGNKVLDENGNEMETPEELKKLMGSAVLWDKADGYIVVVGLIDNARTIRTQLKVSRTMPIMDYVIESNNRLWGCRYGTAENGEVVNEIYASKLGDFKNWKCYMGVSTDSYAVSLGSDGAFTGAINHLGYPLFFKERCLHKVYGAMPSQYQMQTTACRGVQKGSEKSLAIVNEVLYYKGEHGICAYDGSLPVEVSAVFGGEHYTNASAGAHGNKYYVSMDGTDGRVLFVYDTAKGIWHKEEDEGFTMFCSCRDEMFASDGLIIAELLGTGGNDEGDVPWMAETGEIGVTSPDQKAVSRINIRMSMDIGSVVTVLAQYDDSGDWETCFHLEGTNLRSFSMPLRPVRCDTMRLRFEGRGDVRIYSITKTIAQGSDIS